MIIYVVSAVYAANTCPMKAFNIGRGMATREFAKWDKNCTTLETFYEDMLTRDPTKKCLRRGYWDKAQALYEQHSVDCSSVNCQGVGKELGKIIGEAFCNRKTVNSTLSICNAREQSICGETFFDYAFDNCHDAFNYTVFDGYNNKYCQIN